MIKQGFSSVKVKYHKTGSFLRSHLQTQSCNITCGTLFLPYIVYHISCFNFTKEQTFYISLSLFYYSLNAHRKCSCIEKKRKIFGSKKSHSTFTLHSMSMTSIKYTFFAKFPLKGNFQNLKRKNKLIK